MIINNIEQLSKIKSKIDEKINAIGSISKYKVGSASYTLESGYNDLTTTTNLPKGNYLITASLVIECGGNAAFGDVYLFCGENNARIYSGSLMPGNTIVLPVTVTSDNPDITVRMRNNGTECTTFCIWYVYAIYLGPLE